MFHAAYDRARDGEDVAAPVFVVLADSLVVFRGKRRTVRPFGRPEFHVYKTAAHALVSVFALLFEHVDQPLGAALRRKLDRTRRSSRRALAPVSSAPPSPAADALRALETALAFVERVLEDGMVTGTSLRKFAARAGRFVLRLTEDATRIQLFALHDAVEAELRKLGPQERRGMQVVVGGDHQARSRSLAMQYFQARLGEAPGSDLRVTYAEGLESPEEGPRLVGKRRLDRMLASAFFGNPKRLQQDVLGGATELLLKRARLPRIR